MDGVEMNARIRAKGYPNYLVWKYLTTPEGDRIALDKKGRPYDRVFDALVAYCFGAVRNKKLYIRPERLELQYETDTSPNFDDMSDADHGQLQAERDPLAAGRRYESAKVKAMRWEIQLALLKFLAQYQTLGREEIDGAAMSGEFGTLANFVLSRIKNAIRDRKAKKRQEPHEVVSLDAEVTNDEGETTTLGEQLF